MAFRQLLGSFSNHIHNTFGLNDSAFLVEFIVFDV